MFDKSKFYFKLQDYKRRNTTARECKVILPYCNIIAGQGELLLRAKFQVVVILQFLILDTCPKDYVLVKTRPRNYFPILCILFSVGCEQESLNEGKAYKNLSVVYLQV